MNEDIAILIFDCPGKKQNVLSTDAMVQLDQLLDQIPRDASGVVIASGKETSFVAGADISEIAGITTPEIARYKAHQGQAVFNKLASLPMPTVAAINGFCLGGGCELALACTYRVAGLDAKTLMGLPETKLGILPGFGGTQRLPKIVGIRKALELILSGRLVDARGAFRMRLVDRVCSPLLVLQEAIEILRRRPAPARPRFGLIERIIESSFFRSKLLGKALEEAEKKAKGFYPAIPAVIDVFRRTLDLPATDGNVSAEGLKIEADAFAKLVLTDVSENLRFLFFLDDDQKKYAPYKSAPANVRSAAVLGAGVMGGGIAWAFSSKEMPVRVKDIRAEALLSALSKADEVYRGDVKRRKATEIAAKRGMSRISVGLDYAGFRRADMVVEAVLERMEVKKHVLAEVESEVRVETVIATNTSGLSIDEMATVLKRPEKFGGLHFFNPVHRMPLVEIIRGKATSDQTVATLFAVARSLGKTPILVKDSPGFLVNRILIPYMLEAARMYEEGIAIGAIDRVARTFGMPMGPFELADEVGIDVGLHVAEHLERSFGSRMAVPEILRTLVHTGLLGKKSGSGFYIHAKNGDKDRPRLNPAVPRPSSAAQQETGEDGGNTHDIENRLFLTMLLEAGRCLEDGIVDRGEDIEIGMIYGTGFPPHRGGLLRWGSRIGYQNLIKRAAPLRERFGDRYVVPEVFKMLYSENGG